jgi:hypothetical protein
VILKCKKWYQAQLEQCFETIADHNSHCDAMESFLALFYNGMLLETLLNGIEAGISIANPVVSRIGTSLLLERIYEKMIKVISFSFKLSPTFKSSVLRQVLENALNLFPHNSLFWTLYGWNEGSTKIENRFRRFLNVKIKTNPSHVLPLFGVWNAFHQSSTKNIQVIRSILQESLSKPNVSVQTWIVAIDFECMHGELEKAKMLLYQGIASCPWSKGIVYLIRSIHGCV